MRLHLLHGPALSSSRDKLVSIKQKFNPNNVVVFEKEANVQEVLNTLIAPSLFEEEQLVIWENPPDNFVFDSSLISNHSSLILWFDHEVSPKPIMEWVKKNEGEILYFPESKEISVFPFLDYLANKDKRAYLEMDKLKKAGFDIHYLITMVFYMLRSLVATPKNAPAFVKDKLQRQRKRFALEDVENCYKEIIKIDFKIKSGLLEKEQAEFLLVNKFVN
ncbi:hypothetical protein HYT18_03720 [Candidatus Microgenomates bacterium]|nr:hypothetical protein [Candidatus Microgenomates bacterium]